MCPHTTSIHPEAGRHVWRVLAAPARPHACGRQVQQVQQQGADAGATTTPDPCMLPRKASRRVAPHSTNVCRRVAPLTTICTRPALCVLILLCIYVYMCSY